MKRVTKRQKLVKKGDKKSQISVVKKLTKNDKVVHKRHKLVKKKTKSHKLIKKSSKKWQTSETKLQTCNKKSQKVTN